MAKGRKVDLGQITQLFESGATAGLADAELLERFNDRDSATAERSFAILVERHGPMVHRVCRRVLVDPNDADDAFQATFLVLARKAGTLRVAESLGPWLHGVAYRVAMTVRSNAARRRIKEKNAAEVKRGSVPNHEDREIGAKIHEEIERLPGPYRTAIVLCLLEGLTQEQAAERLGWAPGTVRSRLARGREQLQGRLIRRGLSTASALVAASSASEALAASLLKSATAACLPGRAGSPLTGVVSASAVTLSSQFLRSLVMTRIKVVAMLMMLSCVGIAGVQAFGRQDPNPRATAEAARAAAPRMKYMTKDGITATNLTSQLNSADAEGWEFVQAAPASLSNINGGFASYMLIFRRPAETKE
jgi:RNA polymerase sigma factor (sigma-70 family)